MEMSTRSNPSAWLANVYRELRASGANTVPIRLHWTELRAANSFERMNGIAMVHESLGGDGDNPLRQDIALAFEQDSHVRAVVCDDHDTWQLLPNVGRVVEFDATACTFKVVFLD